MINPIEKMKDAFHTIEPKHLSLKVLSAIPILCNIFLAVKEKQLSEKGDFKQLNQIAQVVNDWRVLQLLLIPYIARQVEKMSFKQRTTTIIGLVTVAVVHEAHLEGVREQAEKNL